MHLSRITIAPYGPANGRLGESSRLEASRLPAINRLAVTVRDAEPTDAFVVAIDTVATGHRGSCSTKIIFIHDRDLYVPGSSRLGLSAADRDAHHLHEIGT